VGPAQKDRRHLGECDARREHPRCPLGPNGDLGSSRLEEQLDGKDYTIPRPLKRGPVRAGRGIFGGVAAMSVVKTSNALIEQKISA
jgi:hypothetical protein